METLNLCPDLLPGPSLANTTVPNLQMLMMPPPQPHKTAALRAPDSDRNMLPFGVCGALSMERNGFSDSLEPKSAGNNNTFGSNSHQPFAIPDITTVSHPAPWEAPAAPQGFPFLGAQTPYPFPRLSLTDTFTSPCTQVGSGTTLVPARQQEQPLYKIPQCRAADPLSFKQQEGKSAEVGVLQMPRLTIPPLADPFRYTPFSQVNSGTPAPKVDLPELRPEEQRESIFTHTKKQRDENYRYSLGSISRRVKSWLEHSARYASEAQATLEDSLVQDSRTLDGGDDSLYTVFDEPRRKRFCAQAVSEPCHISVSRSETSGSIRTNSGAAGGPVLSPAQLGALSPQSLRPVVLPGVSTIPCGPSGVYADEVCASPCPTGQPNVPHTPVEIAAVCQTSNVPVNYTELTDRSVLRGWRCRTDESDMLIKRGRKRYFRRVAALPPALWQPNRRARPWEWAPSGPFALQLGEYVSVAGTNGYPYEIVLIRHIPPALQCFLTLIPAPRDIAAQMLNGDTIAPEHPALVHQSVEAVTHKWILNGVRPHVYPDMTVAFQFVNSDLEQDKLQKEQRKLRKQRECPLKASRCASRTASFASNTPPIATDPIQDLLPALSLLSPHNTPIGSAANNPLSLPPPFATGLTSSFCLPPPTPVATSLTCCLRALTQQQQQQQQQQQEQQQQQQQEQQQQQQEPQAPQQAQPFGTALQSSL